LRRKQSAEAGRRECAKEYQGLGPIMVPQSPLSAVSVGERTKKEKGKWKVITD
jgi:hypothetical protein